jgi:hypothetical protein
MLSPSEHERILGMSPGGDVADPAVPPHGGHVPRAQHRTARLQTFQRSTRTTGSGSATVALSRFPKPNRATTSYELIYGLVADLALYDTAYWLLSSGPRSASLRLPVYVGHAATAGTPRAQVTTRCGSTTGASRRASRRQVLAFHGWSPASSTAAARPVHALRRSWPSRSRPPGTGRPGLARGGKVGAVLSRPKDAPEWSDTARKQFKADWESKFTGTGPGVGGTPLLEDGMTLNRVDFSAHEMEFIEGSRLALNTVASVYHVNPTMIGLLDNANYSNVREFRRMLYGDTLGPILAQIEDRSTRSRAPPSTTGPASTSSSTSRRSCKARFEEQTKASSPRWAARG